MNNEFEQEVIDAIKSLQKVASTISVLGYKAQTMFGGKLVAKELHNTARTCYLGVNHLAGMFGLDEVLFEQD